MGGRAGALPADLDLADDGEAAPPAAAAAPPRAAANGSRWLPEHEAKELLRAASLPVVDGRPVSGEDDAVVALSELGGHVVVKLSAPSLQHKADVGAVFLGVRSEEAVRAAHRDPAALAVEGAAVLVERMAPPGAELLVAARADAVVPCLVVGAGGVWTEALDDAALVPLPATPERVETALRTLRAVALFTGGRGRPATSCSRTDSSCSS
jgi:acetate---CoA ligase (ADP-forming)